MIGAAATDVAVHVGDDLIPRRLRILGEQRRRLHDLPGLTVAALRDLLGDPRLLQRVRARRRQAFDRGHAPAGDIGYLNAARAGGLAVEVHRAGTALRDAAPEFRAGQLELLTDDPKQRRVGLCLHADRFAVERKRNVCHAVLHWQSVLNACEIVGGDAPATCGPYR